MDQSSSSPWPSLRLASAALLVSLGGGFNFGYQLLITNPAQEAFLHFLNSSISWDGSLVEREQLEAAWGVVVSLFFWGATIGAFFIQTVADRLGRRRGMALSFFAQAISMALAVFSYFRNAWMIYALSRVLLGAAISVSLGIAPLFITECSPVSCRGIISLATGVMMQIALTVGAIVAMPQLWGTTSSWWKMYAAEGVITLLVSFLSLAIHESPSFLVFTGDVDEAVNSVVFYHDVDEKDASDIVDELVNQKQDTAKNAPGLFEIFKDPIARRGTLVGCTVMAGMILSGIAAINAFAFEILLSVGLSSFGAAVANVAVCAVTVVGVLVSSLLVDRWGRRPLLLFTFSFLAIANIAIGFCMLLFERTHNSSLGWAVVFAICVFNFVFCLGPGPIAFFITGELVSSNSRGAASTWVNVVLNGLRSLLLVVYFPVKSLLGGPLSYMALFLPPCALTAILLYFYLPETKGRTPEEVTKAAKELPSLRKKRETNGPSK